MLGAPRSRHMSTSYQNGEEFKALISCFEHLTIQVLPHVVSLLATASK